MTPATSPAWWSHDDNPSFVTDAWPGTGVKDYVLVPVAAVIVDEHRHGSLPIAFELACLDFIRGCPTGATMLEELKRNGLRITMSSAQTAWKRRDTKPDGDIRIHPRSPWVDCNSGDPDAVELVRLDVVATWTAELDPVTRAAYDTLDACSNELTWASAHFKVHDDPDNAKRTAEHAEAARAAKEAIYQAYVDRIYARSLPDRTGDPKLIDLTTPLHPVHPPVVSSPAAATQEHQE